MRDPLLHVSVTVHCTLQGPSYSLERYIRDKENAARHAFPVFEIKEIVTVICLFDINKRNKFFSFYFIFCAFKDELSFKKNEKRRRKKKKKQNDYFFRHLFNTQ
jgi:hypothetical protein